MNRYYCFDCGGELEADDNSEFGDMFCIQCNEAALAAEKVEDEEGDIPEWRKKPLSPLGQAFFDCFKSPVPAEQIDALNSLSVLLPLPNKHMSGFSVADAVRKLGEME